MPPLAEESTDETNTEFDARVGPMPPLAEPSDSGSEDEEPDSTRPLGMPAPLLEDWTDDELEHQYYDDEADYDVESMYAVRIEHSANVRRRTQGVAGESRPKKFFTTLVAEISINGHKALVLFDSGSTTDSVTPEFAHIARMTQFRLDEQVTLQLGCVGSKSKISYGSHAPVDVLGTVERVYFDIVNIDRYDAILGTPFLERFKVCLDFQDRTVRIKGAIHPTFTYDEEMAYIALRWDPAGVKRSRRPASGPKPLEVIPARVSTEIPLSN